MSIMRQQYKGRDGKPCKSANWYVEIRDHAGKLRRMPGFADKGATKELERNVLRLVALRRVHGHPDAQLAAWLEGMQPAFSERLLKWGILDVQHVTHGKSLTDHLKDFRQSIIDDDSTEEHADTVSARVRNIIHGCKFSYYSDINAAAVQNFLAECRRNGLRGRVARPDKKRPNTKTMSNQTSKHYLTSFKQFCTWMIRNGRATKSPVAFLEAVNPALDRRHDRRTLSADELSRLLTAAATGLVHHKLDGLSRAMLYRVAMETGFRRKELRSLTVSCLNESESSPTITLAAGSAKNRQEAIQPIRPELADELRRFIASRRIVSDAKLWPFITASTSKMIARDLEAARKAWIEEAGDNQAERETRERRDVLTYQDSAGLFADFHSLRHSFISLLARGGVHPKLAQKLARHSDINLTMMRYSHTVLPDESQALASLPSLPSAFGSESPAEVLAATGTDGNDRGSRSRPAKSRAGVLQSVLQARDAFPIGNVRELPSNTPSRQQAKTTVKTAENVSFPSGEGGIRTPGELSPTLVFETSTIGRSVTSPAIDWTCESYWVAALPSRLLQPFCQGFRPGRVATFGSRRDLVRGGVC